MFDEHRFVAGLLCILWTGIYCIGKSLGVALVVDVLARGCKHLCAMSLQCRPTVQILTIMLNFFWEKEHPQNHRPAAHRSTP
jgi:hypothetical protein